MRESRDSRKLKVHHEGVSAETERQIQEDEAEPLVHETEETAHGWGDFRTWAIIIGLAVWLVATTIVVMFLVGQGRLTEWNLGWPPTSPKVIFLLPTLTPGGF